MSSLNSSQEPAILKNRIKELEEINQSLTEERDFLDDNLKSMCGKYYNLLFDFHEIDSSIKRSQRKHTCFACVVGVIAIACIFKFFLS